MATTFEIRPYSDKRKDFKPKVDFLIESFAKAALLFSLGLTREHVTYIRQIIGNTEEGLEGGRKATRH